MGYQRRVHGELNKHTTASYKVNKVKAKQNKIQDEILPEPVLTLLNQRSSSVQWGAGWIWMLAVLIPLQRYLAAVPSRWMLDMLLLIRLQLLVMMWMCLFKLSRSQMSIQMIMYLNQLSK